MNIAVVVAAIACVLSVYVAALSLRFSAAPGWRDQRWFAVAALTAGAYSALNVPIMIRATPTAFTVYLTRFQLLLAAVHVVSWIQYTAVYLDEPLGRFGRWAVAALLVGGGLAQIPGVVYTAEVHQRWYEPLAVVYRDPVTTWFGDLAFVGMLGAFVPLMVRFLLATRRGVPHCTAHAAALGALLALCGHDALNAAGVIFTPYLVDLAYLIPIGVVGYVLTARFAADARALAAIRAHLEALVEQRTKELSNAQEALHRSEKLAALGQLAAGVAHEVSSPAAVVAANLSYLEQQLSAGRTPEDGLQCVLECSVATRRIASISRQLLEAGQLAASGPAPLPVSVGEVAREALATARARCPGHVSLGERVPDDLRALAEQDMLHQVLVNLVVNGVQAVPEGRRGHVEVSGRREGGRVFIVVEDDGGGMPPEVLRRVFEPFFTTKPFGVGTGLGLAVSRGLIAGLGGDLRLESEVGRGTRAVVELMAAEGTRAPSVASGR